MPDLRGAPLFLPALAWLTGLLMTRNLLPEEPLFPHWTAFFTLWGIPLLTLGWAMRERPVARRFALLGLIALAGALRGTLRLLPTLPPPVASAVAEGAEITVEGVVVDDPIERGAGSRFRFRPDGGTALLRVDLPHGRPDYGDRLRLTGRVGRPSPRTDIDLRAALARQGVLGEMKAEEWARLRGGEGHPLLRFLYQVRGHVRTRLREIVPDPEAGVLIGILLGDESGIPWNVERAFARSGLSHIVAISGYNITLLTALSLAIFTPLLGRRAALWATLLLIPLYALFVGASASVVRAALMGSLTVIALMLGRSSDALNALSLSAFLMTLWDPVALEDIGFQLSFAATMGLLFLAPPLEAWARAGIAHLFRDPHAAALVDAIREALLVSLAAQIATAPLMLYHFRELSVVAPLANLLTLPMQPFVMAMGIPAAIGAALLGRLAAPLGWAVWWPLAWTIRIADLAARWPLATVRIAPGYLEGMLILYGIGLGFFLTRAYGLSFGELVVRLHPHRHTIRVLGLVGALGGIAFTYLPDSQTRMVLFEGGHALLLETPGGHRALWLGGDPPLGELGRWLGPFDRRLDLVVVEGEKAPQHLKPLQDRYRIRYVLGKDSPIPVGLRVEMDAVTLEAIEGGWQVRIGRQWAVITRQRAVEEGVAADLVIALGDERRGLAVARQTNAWGLLVGGTPAGGAASAVSGLRHVWRARDRRWIAAWTDGEAWWVGTGP
ncbi:ComEC/Rec2 family competence protein [Thermoflexus sp.]|uniref:ComEC/Rec2 family competence protein n=1 Tax=Thermoflexus sp. TaxID=1969742 RepID=UPI00262A923F|nr:ComEC/Rec2 family competence protein [Thermoflexus sp.]MCX7691429.1 ComEC family competence protein [Thermoflexus sp.]